MQESDRDVGCKYCSKKRRLERMRKIHRSSLQRQSWKKEVQCVAVFLTARSLSQQPEEMAGESYLLLEAWSLKLNRGKSHFPKLSRQAKPLDYDGWKAINAWEGREEAKPFRLRRKGGMTRHPWSRGDGAEKSPKRHLSVKCWLEKVASSCVLDNEHQRYPTVMLLSSEWKQHTGTVNDSYLLTVLS